MESLQRTLFLACLVVLGVAVRILFADIPNFAPVGALALFAGASFADKRIAVLLPLVVMLITDWILGFHSSVLYVYAGMLAYSAAGMWAGNGLKWKRLLPAVLSGSLAFFIISNIGAFFAFYPRTWSGLVECFIQAIPFFDRTLISDLFFSLLLFGALALAEKYSPALKPCSAVKG